MVNAPLSNRLAYSRLTRSSSGCAPILGVSRSPLLHNRPLEPALGTANPGDLTTPVSQTTVTDRNGNQTEYQFSQQGKIVRIRKFVNRAIRPGDPPFFETQCEYNQDEELTLLRRPE